VFADDDLDSIRNKVEFLEYKKISDKRYYEASKLSSTLCTWKKVKSTKLALVLHGNQQNIHSDNGYWRFLEEKGYQVEYIQSQTIDSYRLYRWENDENTQLDRIIMQLPWQKYKAHALCGFSAGCNEILKTLLYTKINCEKIMRQSPWIPVIDNNLNNLLIVLSNTKIEITCGQNDNDCLPYTKKLAEEATSRGLNCSLQILDGLGHGYPTF